MYLGDNNVRTVVPRVVYEHPVRTDRFIRCSGRVFSLLNPKLRCGLEKGHDGRHRKILEPKKRWESLLPSAPEEKKFSDMTLEEKYKLPTCEVCHSGLMAQVIDFREGKTRVGLCCSCDNIHDWQFPVPDEAKMKPYLVTIEVRAEDLEMAKAIAKTYDPGKVVSVIQKYRMTNYGTEWHNPEMEP